MSAAPLAWIVDDDRAVRLVLAAALREAGFDAREFGDAESALAAFAEASPDLLFTDVRMAGASGLKLLERVVAQWPRLPVIVMSAFTDVATTASAYRLGAFDYLPKPFDLDQAVASARRALAQHPAGAPAPVAADYAEHELIGRSAAMRELFRAIGRVAASGLGALVTGETGTGKELVARALHRESARAGQPFVALNTAAIPSELLESELFGHEAGAFTGAARRHAGRFEQAERGTLFLDEVGDMPLALQTRLLRVLAAGEFYRVGGRELIRADVRVIAATHQDLDAKVARGEFRADLLHRLDVVRLEVPALRARADDVPLLAEHFLARAVALAGGEAKHFTPAALGALRGYAWPGNVRQLENLCRRLAVLAPGREVGVGDLPPAIVHETVAAEPDGWEAALRRWAEARLGAGASDLHREASAVLERVLLDAALAAHDGHRQNAARSLGLGRNTMTRKLGSSRRRPR
ncbi:two-component system nitrogen regulation response regulator GlnG [Dokdonella fugitiva]|uniref:DNA-binding transcriptional regulator NtrC n=1 Tax=Dokdonella fugitiva TaxID=328517 RepID=A0A839EYK1_9GAMM|nr:nitrogen regulation protein NR(I) [Dokdonella fugitiva]MBA8887713.1 two-component system nitrogen regulation response regulator GlnG [Dokdonella fugitiva]